MLAVLAQGYSDCNQAAVLLYNNQSPTSAQGTGLSSSVKLNGMKRQTGTYSTAPAQITGVANTVISAGLINDANGFQWALPANTTIPGSGVLNLTVTCTTIGPIAVSATTGASIANPSLGWQSVQFTGNSTPGTNIEQDGALRQRQSATVTGPSSAMLDAIVAAVAGVTGVTAYVGHENNTGSTDSYGVPRNTVWIVAEGGNASSIAQAIQSKKAGGIGTYGSQSVVVFDSQGMPVTINFDFFTQEPITVDVTIQPLAGYTAPVASAIQTAVANFINSLGGGGDVYPGQVQGAAALSNVSAGATFAITLLTCAIGAGSQSTNPIPINFNQIATCTTGSVNVTVL